MKCGRKENKMTPMKAIRLKCLDCSGGSSPEVDLCPIKECSLYIYRHGNNPARTGYKKTPEQKAIAKENLKKARESKKTVTS
jgi:hypothetical protein